MKKGVKINRENREKKNYMSYIGAYVVAAWRIFAIYV